MAGLRSDDLNTTKRCRVFDRLLSHYFTLRLSFEIFRKSPETSVKCVIKVTSSTAHEREREKAGKLILSFFAKKIEKTFKKFYILSCAAASAATKS